MIRTRYYQLSKTNNSIGSPGLLFVEKSKNKDYPKIIFTTFYIFAAYLVVPVVEVPLLGLSVSAPLFFIIAASAVFKPPYSWLKQNQTWIMFSALLILGIFMSTTLNGVLSFGEEFDSGEVASLLQYAYWIIVFTITSHFAAQKNVLKNLASIFAWSVLILSLLRWGEAIFFGRLGAGADLILTQNSYGFQFSTFSPFLLLKVFETKGKERFWWLLSLVVCLGAIALNGSRGSWISIAIGFGFIFLILISFKPKRFGGLIFALLFLIGAILALANIFPQIRGVVEQRYNTFENLEEDKSVLIRELMVQKGIRLFKESPLFGVGAGRFTKETILLDLPKQLSYATQNDYNRKSAHNSYIQFLAEFGLAGAIPFGVLLLILLINGITSTVIELRIGEMLSLAVLFSFIQMSIHMWVITAITNTCTWFIYGLVAAMIMIKRNLISE